MAMTDSRFSPAQIRDPMYGKDGVMSPVWVRWFNELYNFKEELEGFYHEEVPVDLDPEMSATLERLEMVENETFGREPPPSLDEIYSRLDSLEAEIASMPGTFTQTLTSGVTDRLITMDASPSTLILSDDNTDQTLTGNLGALNLLTPAGVYSFGSVAANTDITINFPGTTSSGQFKWMEDEDRFETPDDLKVDADFNVTGELAGAKMLIPFMRSNITADAYATYGAITLTGDRCPVMPRAGSVTGLAINVYGSGATSAGDVVVSVRKNDVDVLSVTLTFTLVAGVVKGYVTQARGTDTFAAGDVLTVYFDFTTFAGTVGNGCILVEVQFDT